MIDHLFAIGIHAYYAGELEAGRRACERLLAMEGVPEEVEAWTRHNRLYYTQPLRELVAVREVEFDLEPAHEGWSLFNPTIIYRPFEQDYLAIVRSSNYKIRDGRYEMPPADGGTIRTQNILVRLHDDLSVDWARVIADPDYAKTGYPVDGLEDCRLMWLGGGLGVSAVVRNASPWTDGRCRIATARLDIETASFSDLRVLDGVTVLEHEKNWMPVIGRGGWVHSLAFDGHTITVDEEGDAYVVCRRAAMPPIARSWRGGGQLVPFHGGYLGVIHEVAPLGDHRAYEHRFVFLDNSLSLRLASPAFVFGQTRQIEFAAGLAADEDRVIVTFGVRDAQAWICELLADDVWSLLKPLSLPDTSV